MHHVALADIVGADRECLIDGFLVIQHSSPAPALVEDGIVPFRKDVLGGKDMEVVGFLRFVRQERPPVCKFRVRSLGVVHGEVLCGITPGGEI